MFQVLLLTHLVGVVVMAAAHGVSIFAAFRVRREADPRIVATILAMSKSAVTLLYLGFGLLAIGGFGAAWQTGALLAPWAIASYAVLVVVIVVMTAIATPYYGRVRQLVGAGTGDAMDTAAMHAALDSRRPELLAIVGTSGLLVLLWLMVVRPA